MYSHLITLLTDNRACGEFTTTLLQEERLECLPKPKGDSGIFMAGITFQPVLGYGNVVNLISLGIYNF